MRGKTLETTTTAVSDPTAAAVPEGEEELLIVMCGNNVGEIHPLDRRRSLVIVGRDDEADIQVLDAEISRRHAGIRFDAGRGLFVLGDLESRNGTKLNGEPVTGEQVLRVGDKIYLGTTVLRLSLASEPEAQYAQQMYQAVLRDGLTGAFNRRYLDERLAAEVAYALRHETPLVVLLADLDHFKRVNDQFGHRTGDHVLREFVQVVTAAVRTEDVVARYGGEEFAILCRDTDERTAGTLAERLRSAVATRRFEHEGKVVPLTVSIGFAGIHDVQAKTASEMLEAADRALYAAKSAGRDRWCAASHRPPASAAAPTST